MPKMDEVDKQQQREIDDLKAVNERQDAFVKNMVWAFVIFGVIQFLSSLMYLSSLEKYVGK